MRTTIQAVQAMKRRGEKIAMITAYDHPSAAIAERAGAHILLVGDSLGMVVHGHETTLKVSLDDMARHAAAVVRGCQTPLVIADLPFLSYADLPTAVASAGRLMRETGAGAVKLEGGRPVVEIVRRLVELGVPVMGHLGYTPQSTLQIGVRVQGKDPAAAEALMADARALEAAGAFALVLELVPEALAGEISQALSIPVIGIGAGPRCDGQVQVWHDVLGLSGGKVPKHARRYVDLAAAAEAAVRAYVEDVRTGFAPPREGP